MAALMTESIVDIDMERSEVVQELAQSHGACADAETDDTSQDVSDAVEDTMGQLLMDIEIQENPEANMEADKGTNSENLNSTVPLTMSEGQIKLELEEKKDVIADTEPRQPGPPDPTDKSKDEPIVIDLSDDDDEEYSKENIEKTPAKSLNGLLKCLSAEQSAELLGKIKMAITNLPREVLEDMYFTKIQENIEIEASLRKFEGKVTSFMLYKDRVTFKAQCLQGQLIDSARAMATVTDQLTRNPKNVLKAYNPSPSPLKFQRTVGIQCRNDPLPRLKAAPLSNSRILNAPASNPVTTNGKKAGIPATKNGIIPQTVVSQQQITVNGTKRGKQTVNVEDIRNQVQPEVPNKVARRPGPASMIRTLTEKNYGIQNHNQSTVDNPIVLTNGGVPTLTPAPQALIDLASQVQNNLQNVVVNNTGVHYHVVKPNNYQQGMQITTQSGQSYQLVPTGVGQTQRRSFVVQQKAAPTVNVNTGHVVVLPPPGSTLQSQNIQRSPNRMVGQPRPVQLPQNNTRPIIPRTPAATLNNLNVVARTQMSPKPAMNTPLPKFFLPELPPMSPQPKKPKEPPPRPTLTLQEQGGGIVLSWTHISSAIYAEIQSYQIFACQEPISNIGGRPAPAPVWKRVGDVKALPLPMACTLSQFTDEYRYYFIVRGVDVYNRTGLFCEIVNILLSSRR